MLELRHYLLNIDDEEVIVDNFIELLHDELSPKVGKQMSNLAEKLREEGLDSGLIAKITKLPLARIKALQNKL